MRIVGSPKSIKMIKCSLEVWWISKYLTCKTSPRPLIKMLKHSWHCNKHTKKTTKDLTVMNKNIWFDSVPRGVLLWNNNASKHLKEFFSGCVIGVIIHSVCTNTKYVTDWHDYMSSDKTTQFGQLIEFWRKHYYYYLLFFSNAKKNLK